MAQVSFTPIALNAPKDRSVINTIFSNFQAAINSVDSTQIATGSVLKAALSSAVLAYIVPQHGTQSSASSQSTASTATYVAMTNGPSLTVPTTGTYRVAAFGAIQNPGAVLMEARVQIAVGGTPTVQVGWLVSSTLSEGVVTGAPTYMALTAGNVLTLRVATNNQTASFGNPQTWVLEAVLAA